MSKRLFDLSESGKDIFAEVKKKFCQSHPLISVSKLKHFGE